MIDFIIKVAGKDIDTKCVYPDYVCRQFWGNVRGHHYNDLKAVSQNVRSIIVVGSNEADPHWDKITIITEDGYEIVLRSTTFSFTRKRHQMIRVMMNEDSVRVANDFFRNIMGIERKPNIVYCSDLP